MQGLDGFGIGAIHHAAAVAPDVDQADIAQNAEVLGYRRLAELEGRDDLADGAFLENEVVENIAATGLTDRVEGIRRGGYARHENNIYPYRNMSRCFFHPIVT